MQKLPLAVEGDWGHEVTGLLQEMGVECDPHAPGIPIRIVVGREKMRPYCNVIHYKDSKGKDAWCLEHEARETEYGKPTMRSAWWGYFGEADCLQEKYFVGLPEVGNIAKSGFTNKHLYLQVLKNVIGIASQEMWFPEIKYSTKVPDDIRQKNQEFVYVDIETVDDEIVTLGISVDDGPVYSLPWNHATKQLLRKTHDWGGWLVTHNMTFDIPRLEKEGVKVKRGAVICTMRAHKHRYPALRMGLGHCAHLYWPMEAWKHLAKRNPDKYNAIDVWAMKPLAKHLLPDLKSGSDLMTVMQYEWLKEDANGTCTVVSPDREPIQVQCEFKPGWAGKGDVEPLAGKVGPSFKGVRRGWRPRLEDRLFQSASQRSAWAYSTSEAVAELVRLHTGEEVTYPGRGGLEGGAIYDALLTGWGPSQAAKRLTGKATWAWIKPYLEDLEKMNPAWKDWKLKFTTRQNGRERLENPFGRVVYGLRGNNAMVWYILSTLMDALQSFVVSQNVPFYYWDGAMCLTSQLGTSGQESAYVPGYGDIPVKVVKYECDWEQNDLFQ